MIDRFRFNYFLFVPAQFSNPTVTISCDEEDADFSCLVTCSSHGGFPHSKMMWNVPVSGNASQRWNLVNWSEVPDPDTKIYNSSSTARFLCSYGELKSVSCSVGEVTSHMFSVCE